MQSPLAASAAFLFILAAPCLTAAPLQQASISKIINEVRVVDPQAGAHAAAVDEVIKKDLGVKTGVKSRAELLFQDQTLTRLGAETYFSFQPGTRDMELREGTMLLQVPKGLGGATIRTAAVTASITGTTIMMEYWPGKDVKVLVLEGSLRLSVNGRLGEAVTLTPGKMMLMKPGDKHLPEPVNVDLAKIVKTSSLIDPGAFKGKSKISVAPLPSLGLIQKEITVQATMKQNAGLADTNLVIPGKGNKVLVIADLSDTQTTTELIPTSSNSSTDKSSQAAIATGQKQPPAPTDNSGSTSSTDAPAPPARINRAAPLIASPAPYVISSATSISTAKPGIVTAGVHREGGVYYGNGQSQVAPSDFLFGDHSAALDANFDNDVAGLDSRGVADSGLAVYRFRALQLGTAPTFTGFRKNIALSADGGINPATLTSSWGVDAIRSLTLTSQVGNISLGNGFTAAASSDFRLLEVYARAGTVDITAPITTPDAAISLIAGGLGGINVSAAGTIDARAVSLLSSGTVTLHGAIQPGLLTIVAPTLISTVDLTPTAGALAIGSGGIQAGDHTLSGFSSITSLGNVTAGTLQAGTIISIAGTVGQPASGAPVTLDAPVLSVGGGIQLNGATAMAPGNGGQVTLHADFILIGAPTGTFAAAGPDGKGPGKDGGKPKDAGKPKGDGGDNGNNQGDNQGDGSPAPAPSIPAINGIVANGGDAQPGLFAIGGDGGTIQIGTAGRAITGDVTINKDVSAVAGKNAPGALLGGAGGTVNVVAGGTIAVNAKVTVSDGTPNARSGGNIRLVSHKTTGTAIAVSNSGQLLSLLNMTAAGPGGKVQLLSSGGAITVGSGKVEADRGQVVLQNDGAGGTIGLDKANLRGDVVKAGALGTNGQLLINGGTIDADTLIALYAGGSNGTVRFLKSTNLSGTSAKVIAANTVTIDNKQKVNVTGPAASVYTNHGNYTGSGGNGSTTGAFTGSGATTSPYAGRPGF